MKIANSMLFLQHKSVSSRTRGQNKHSLGVPRFGAEILSSANVPLMKRISLPSGGPLEIGLSAYENTGDVALYVQRNYTVPDGQGGVKTVTLKTHLQATHVRCFPGAQMMNDVRLTMRGKYGTAYYPASAFKRSVPASPKPLEDTQAFIPNRDMPGDIDMRGKARQTLDTLTRAIQYFYLTQIEPAILQCLEGKVAPKKDASKLAEPDADVLEKLFRLPLDDAMQNLGVIQTRGGKTVYSSGFHALSLQNIGGPTNRPDYLDL